MIYRRCACRDEHGKPYGNLPADNPKPQQVARACPRLVSDRKHGRWGYYLSRGFDGSGKRLQTRVANFPSERAARSAYAKAKTLHDTGLHVETSRTRFTDWLREWIDGREARGELKPSTVEDYRRYIDNDIAPSPLGRMRLTDIRRADVRRFVDDLVRAGRGTYTIKNLVRGPLSGALTAAVREDVIAANPAHGVAIPQPGRSEFEPWEPAQVGTFLDHAASDRLGALFEVAVFTGMRRGELLGLRWTDVDLARRTLTVRSTRVQTSGGVIEGSPKTSAGRRVVQLDDAAAGALIAWRLRQDGERHEWGAAWQATGYVFTYEDGTPLRPQYVSRRFDAMRKAAGLPPMKFHGLRHEHASLLLASGADIAIVSKRLGHSSISITSDVYAHLLDDAGRAAAAGASALVPRVGAQQVHNERASA